MSITLGGCPYCGSQLGWVCGCQHTDRAASIESQRKAEGMIQQDTEKLRAGGVVTDRAIHVDAEGNEVDENSPRVRAQLYGAGAVVTAEDAKRYGIKAPKAGKGESSGESENPAQALVDSALMLRLEGYDRIIASMGERIAQLERDVEDFMRLETDPASDLHGGEMAADKAGVVGKDAPAPENKSGVPTTEETKNQGGAVVAAANTPQAQPKRGKDK